jgi:hypothetical protein
MKLLRRVVLSFILLLVSCLGIAAKDVRIFTPYVGLVGNQYSNKDQALDLDDTGAQAELVRGGTSSAVRGRVEQSRVKNGADYIDEMMITETIEHKSSSKLIHLDTSIMIVVFIPRGPLVSDSPIEL